MHLVTPSIGAIGRIVVDATAAVPLAELPEHQGVPRRRRSAARLSHRTTSSATTSSRTTSSFARGPIEILSCQLAAVGFFDAGDAFDSWSTFEPFQSVGVGLRALFPQLDRGVFRADLGFPIERPINSANGLPIAPFAFLLSFGQALTVPSVAPTPCSRPSKKRSPTSLRRRRSGHPSQTIMAP